MSQVIMLFPFPIGLYFYFFVERKNRPAYEKVFDDFHIETKRNYLLSKEEKIQHYKNMLLKNNYIIKEKTSIKVIGEKRIFSMSLFAMGVGLYFVGAILYMAYYYWLQKPHRVVFTTENKL